MEVDKGYDQTSDIHPHWMAAHARLKNESTEDEKYHNLMSWLNCTFISVNKVHFMLVCIMYTVVSSAELATLQRLINISIII